LTNLRIKDIDFSAKEVSVIWKGGKKDTVSITPSSLDDLTKYLEVRKEKYKASYGENEYLFVRNYKGKVKFTNSFLGKNKLYSSAGYAPGYAQANLVILPKEA
jgi:integrase